MPRKPRATAESNVYHVLNRGVDRCEIFLSNEDRFAFGRGLNEIYDEFGIETYAYCLMTNHYHLMLHDPQGQLSEAMHVFMSTYVRRLNDRVGRDGPLFRDRFRSIPVTTDSYFLWLSRYIHRNPLAIGTVNHPASYRWSSYRAYLGHRQRPRFLEPTPLLDRFDGQIDRFAHFTEQELDASLIPRQSAELVDFVNLAVNLEAISTDERARPHVDRTLMVLLSNSDLTDDVNPPTTAARMRRSRAVKRAEADSTVRRMFDDLTSILRPAA